MFLRLSTYQRSLSAAGALMLALGPVVPALAQSRVSVVVNGQPATFNPPPIERGGRVYVPLRGVFERLGASVVYDGGTINATAIDRTVSFKVGATEATINGVPQQLDAPPFIVGSSTYVPLRFVSQALGSTVDYDAVNKVVSLRTLGAQAAAGAAAAAGQGAASPGEAPKNFVQLTSLNDGQVVAGNVFLVAGRTAVQSRVHIVAAEYVGDAVADSTGYFSQQVTLNKPPPRGSKFDVTVTSTDPITGASAQQKVTLQVQ